MGRALMRSIVLLFTLLLLSGPGLAQEKPSAKDAAVIQKCIKEKTGRNWAWENCIGIISKPCTKDEGAMRPQEVMPRAIGCFRKAGFPVEAYPVGWLTGVDVNVGPSLVFSSGLAQFDSAAREWIGLMAYWVTGKTDEFLPRPR